jgi:hypothetical protein
MSPLFGTFLLRKLKLKLKLGRNSAVGVGPKKILRKNISSNKIPKSLNGNAEVDLKLILVLNGTFLIEFHGISTYDLRGTFLSWPDFCLKQVNSARIDLIGPRVDRGISVLDSR